MTDGARTVESRIEELVELEQELQQTSGTVTDGVYEEGVIAGAERIPASEVPEDYPVAIESEQALRIDVETDGGIVETYMEWAPDAEGAGHVESLLEVLGRQPDEFASIFGDPVALDHQDGYHGIDAEGTARIHRTGDPPLGIDFGFLDSLQTQYNRELIGGLIVVAAISGEFSFLGIEDPANTVLGLASIGLALTVGLDAKRMREEGDWEPVVPLWAIGSLVPFLNVPVATGYLFRRREKRGSLPGEISAAWLYAAALAGLTSLVAIPVLFVSTKAVVLVWLFTVILLPMAVFYDFDYVETENYRDVKRIALTVVTAAFSLYFAGFVPAAAYLFFRLW